MARNFVVGSTQYIEFPRIDSLLTTQYTVAQRFKINALQTTDLGLAAHAISPSGTVALFYFTVQTDGLVRFLVQGSGSGFPSVNVITTTAPSIGVWHSVIGTRNVDTTEIFLNSVSEHSLTAGSTIGTIVSNSFLIGAIDYGGITQAYYDGDIADIAVWSVVLTQNEIDAYNKGVSPTLIRPDKLVSYIPFWGTTQEPDLGGSGGIGTFVNTPVISTTNPPVGSYVRNKRITPFLAPTTKLHIRDLSNLYNVNPATLVLSELQNKYKIIPSILGLSELQNKYTIEVPSLELSEVQNQYLVPDQTLRTQLEALYSLRFAIQLEALYGATVARQLEAQAYYSLSTQLEVIYTIRGDVAKQIDSIYDITTTSFVDKQLKAIYSMAQITTQLEGIYSIGPVVTTQLTAPYILATVPVAKQFNVIYDIKTTNTVLKQLKAIYSILTTQIINITGQPTITLGNETFDISDADIGIDEGSFVWRARIGILNIEDYVKFEINDVITFNLYGETFSLVVESKMLSRSGPANIKMGIIAVSPAIKFDFPRATALDLSFTDDTTAEAAAELALSGEDIEWTIPDWTIPANRLAIKDGSPIELVKIIVEAAGGVLESKPDGTLVARPLFPISLTDFDTSTVDQTYTDNSDNMSVSEKYSPTKRLNKFRILDISSEFRDTMEFEFNTITTPNGDSETSTTDGILKIFTSPFREAVSVESSQESNVAFQLVGTVTDQLTEQVEFKEGFATVSRPIQSIDTIVWEGQSLGSLTFTAEDTKMFSASVVNLYGLATITYTTKFIKYIVSGQESMNTQFRLLEGS